MIVLAGKRKCLITPDTKSNFEYAKTTKKSDDYELKVYTIIIIDDEPPHNANPTNQTPVCLPENHRQQEQNPQDDPDQRQYCKNTKEVSNWIF